MGIRVQYVPARVNAAAILRAAAPAATHAAAEYLLEASQPLVPVDTGTLRDSGRVEQVSPNATRVVYDAVASDGYPYGIKIHEDMTLHHPNGGQAKYLEQPATTDAAGILGVLAATLRRLFR